MAEGDSSYDQQRLWKDFGIRPQSADFDDKLALCSVISECFRLEVFEKSKFITEMLDILHPVLFS